MTGPMLAMGHAGKGLFEFGGLWLQWGANLLTGTYPEAPEQLTRTILSIPENLSDGFAQSLQDFSSGDTHRIFYGATNLAMIFSPYIAGKAGETGMGVGGPSWTWEGDALPGSKAGGRAAYLDDVAGGATSSRAISSAEAWGSYGGFPAWAGEFSAAEMRLAHGELFPTWAGVEAAANVSGSVRAAQYSQNWKVGDLGAAVEIFVGKNPTITFSETGKRIYSTPGNSIRVVEDMSGNYFRIQDTSLPGKRSYLDLDGKIVPNNKVLENGRQVGRTQGEYNSETHFQVK